MKTTLYLLITVASPWIAMILLVMATPLLILACPLMAFDSWLLEQPEYQQGGTDWSYNTGGGL